MSITIFNDLASAAKSPTRIVVDKVAMSGASTTSQFSTWGLASSDGVTWPAGSTPVSETLDKNSVGALPIPAVDAGKTLYLARLRVLPASTSNELNHFINFYDRLSQVGGLNGTLTTAQTVNTPALPRHVSGVGVFAYLEIHTIVGTTLATATVSYTNQSGVAGRSGTTTIGSTGLREARAWRRVELQSGDTGVRSVESVTLSASTGTAGAFGVVLARPWVQIARRANGVEDLDWASLGFPTIPHASACIFSTTGFETSPASLYQFDWVQG